MTALAELLDRLKTEDQAFINESERHVTVSGLSAANATVISNVCGEIEWRAPIRDSESTEWEVAQLEDGLGPFLIEITKPEAPPDTLQLLTNAGFSSWLRKDDLRQRWRVARLPGQLITRGALFAPWDVDTQFEMSEATKSPRAIVREHGSQRVAPKDIRPWLLNEEALNFFEDPTFRVWANAAILAILRSLADEIGQDAEVLRFGGSPRLNLTSPSGQEDHTANLGEESFWALQSSARWVFENDREAEMRHILFATEFARSNAGDGDAINCVRRNMVHALDGAKIAYQMGLSELSRDTLVALADLRRSITDETAKLAEITRQFATGLAGALALGVGLVAARIALLANPPLVLTLMLVADAYVIMNIYSGVQFVRLQRKLRLDWQPHLYRFLPTADYDRMVKRPVEKAERIYLWVAALGFVSIALLTIVILFLALKPAEQPTHSSKSSDVEQSTMGSSTSGPASEKLDSSESGTPKSASGNDAKPSIESIPQVPAVEPTATENSAVPEKPISKVDAGPTRVAPAVSSAEETAPQNTVEPELKGEVIRESEDVETLKVRRMKEKESSGQQTPEKLNEPKPKQNDVNQSSSNATSN